MKTISIQFFILVIFLSGCASVASPKKFKEGFDSIVEEDYFSTIDPAKINIKIMTKHDEPVAIDKIKLLMSIRANQDGAVIEEHQMEGRLVLVSDEDLMPAKSLNPFKFSPEHVYIAKLDEAGIDSFKEFQTSVMTSIMPLVKEAKRNKKLNRGSKKGKNKFSAALGFAFVGEGSPSKHEPLKNTKINMATLFFDTYSFFDIQFSENDDYLPIFRPCLWPFCLL